MSRRVPKVLSRLLTVSFGTLSLVGTARAHEGSTLLPGGRPVGLTTLVGCSVLVCLGCGLLALGWRPRFVRRVRLSGPSPTSVLFVVLGLSFLVPAVAANPSLAVLGGLLAAVVAGGAVTRSNGIGHRHAHLSTGAIVTHRLLEGSLLAAVYVTDATVGLVGAVALTLHAAVETVAVGRAYADSLSRAVGAVVLVQVAFVAGALVGLVTTVSLPDAATHLVLAGAGVVLVFVGLSAASPSAH